MVRPVLFGLDPETAHELTLGMLGAASHTPLKFAYRQPRVRDPLRLMGIDFPNRVGLAAGLDKNGAHIDALADMGFGFIEVGTVTPLAQPGNPKPRMFRIPQRQALINRMGFNNDGLQAFVANVQRSRRPVPIGLNIGKNAATPIERATDDYLTALRGVYAHADYVTVNISSPNTKNLRALQADDALEQLLTALVAERKRLQDTHARNVPLALKIAPDLDDAQLDAIADALQRHGIDAVIATNTTVARDAVAGLPHAQEAGGLSGAPVLGASNAVIRHLRKRLGAAYPIIGVGGITSSRDALSKIEAGANLVQLYTGLIYEGPALVTRCARALAAR
ncbi:MAG: quinone-dependent dihydroorotate dehydrogenase [Betaproteobacteria bacterium]|nr:quinone-dependent dihydroorotate dehydrogenase [Betaproteobacteria bacterium]